MNIATANSTYRAGGRSVVMARSGTDSRWNSNPWPRVCFWGDVGALKTMFRLGAGLATTVLTLSMLATPLGGAAAQPAKKGGAPAAAATCRACCTAAAPRAAPAPAPAPRMSAPAAAPAQRLRPRRERLPRRSCVRARGPVCAARGPAGAGDIPARTRPRASRRRHRAPRPIAAAPVRATSAHRAARAGHPAASGQPAERPAAIDVDPECRCGRCQQQRLQQLETRRRLSGSERRELRQLQRDERQNVQRIQSGEQQRKPRALATHSASRQLEAKAQLNPTAERRELQQLRRDAAARQQNLTAERTAEPDGRPAEDRCHRQSAADSGVAVEGPAEPLRTARAAQLRRDERQNAQQNLTADQQKAAATNNQQRIQELQAKGRLTPHTNSANCASCSATSGRIARLQRAAAAERRSSRIAGAQDRPRKRARTSAAKRFRRSRCSRGGSPRTCRRTTRAPRGEAARQGWRRWLPGGSACWRLMCRGAARCTGRTPTLTCSITRSGPTPTIRAIGPTPMTTSSTACSSPTARLTSNTPPKAPMKATAPTPALPPVAPRRATTTARRAGRAGAGPGQPGPRQPGDARLLRRPGERRHGMADRARSPTRCSRAAEQKALLDNLRKASQEAAAQFRDACPESVPMTPPGRLQAMTQRLQATCDAVEHREARAGGVLQSLTDEQKARFNEIGPQLPGRGRQRPQRTAEANTGARLAGQLQQRKGRPFQHRHRPDRGARCSRPKRRTLRSTGSMRRCRRRSTSCARPARTPSR